MSNELAIAAVTTTLRNLINQNLRDELGSGVVTTRPPDKARQNGESTNQINLFLYQTQVNGQWRNRDIPTQVRPGETGRSPLALNLYYLVTIYGQDDDDIAGHRLLGGAMRVLHDHAILQPGEIRTALAESDLHNQIERVRITPVPLSLEDISKLWTTFQTQYRISAAYEASVILIDSAVLTRTPLPVLTRGTDDRGIKVQPNLLHPYPTLESIELPNQQVAAQLGDRLILRGYTLGSDDGRVQIFLKHSRLDDPLILEGEVQEKGQAIALTIPDDPEVYLAGFYTLTVQLQREGREETSNALSLAIAPQIQSITPDISEEGEPVLRVICQPQVQSSQRVSLLLGSRSIPQIYPLNPPERTESLVFSRRGLPSGEYWIRLRVDAVDSLLIDRSVIPPRFDERWRLTLP